MRTVMVAASVAMGMATGAQALTVSVSAEGLANASSAEAAFLAGKVVTASETFEGFPVGRGLTFGTGVGDFTDNDPGNFDGNGLGVLDGGASPFTGRFNVTAGGDNWLDSFDSRDVELSLILPGNATGLGFFMTDLDDQGADTKLTIKDSGGGVLLSMFDLTPSAQGSGSVYYVAIDFMGADVSTLQWTLTNTSDGWGVDDFSAVAPVPLPAAGWMLVAGIGALAARARRR